MESEAHRNQTLYFLWQQWFSILSFGVQSNFKEHNWGFPGGAVVENLPANAGDTGSSPGLGGSHMPRSN